MPRPLIIKVDDHKPQPNKKAIGSISVQLLKDNRSVYEASTSENYNVHDQHDASTDISQYGSSIVRSLINKYESSTARSNLAKFKSKSLADLPRPQTSLVAATKTTQDDFLYNRSIYKDSENDKFDFKRVFSKFEDPTHLHKKIGISHSRIENLNLSDIKQRARLLLENYRHESNYSLWQNQVIELLQQIDNLENPVITGFDLALSRKEERFLPLEKEGKSSTKIQYYDKESDNDRAVHVRDIKNIFEEKTDSKMTFSRANSSSHSAYLGITADGNDVHNEHRRVKSSISIEQLKYFNGDSHDNEKFVNKYSTEEFSSDVPDEVDAGFQSESSGKVDELRNFFESEPGNYASYKNVLENEENKTETDTVLPEENVHIVGNRMLPPPKICVRDEEINNEDIETSLNRIQELMEVLETYERKIMNLSDETIEDGSYINEDLIRILIELDEITTYGDKDVLMNRKNAIQSVQNCIQKLRGKLNAES
ncbi:hypothetical protein ILUMI_04843 [Ignelater luminosus]|uniref:BAG domain-containing protein n=1 Tax=Ignelater luminosus TaxID=2038154 RepID=A0A8K0DD29_IGNLU|nr:hypothetical protein ILUMI_04843 [Ignelater luminosus]